MQLNFGRSIELSVLGFFIFIKLLSIYLVRTFYVADEYWQSLEVAHHKVFGYGYLTWEWDYNIRSYIYPFIISNIYKVLAIIKLDYPSMIIYSPRVFQAILSGYAEYRFYLWHKNDATMLYLFMNPFWIYCASRTLTNTMETCLTMITLSVFPWDNERKYGSQYLWLVGFMCFIRPTAAIMWAPLCLYHIYTSNKTILQLIRDYVLIGLCTFTIATAIDSYYYGKFVITPWEFFKINVLTEVASHYGVEPSYWYLLNALPVFLLVKIFILPISIYQIIKTQKINSKPVITLGIVLWTITIYSMLPHKEHRFILPLLPLLIYICTCFEYPKSVSITMKKVVNVIMYLMNLSVLIYIAMIHQYASLQIMSYLGDEISNSTANVDVMFLTPCHSTPFYSHVHENIPMEFLTCEPNLNNQENYQDQADIFFSNPMDWIENRYSNSSLPKLLVMYDNLVPQIGKFLDDNYRLVVELFDTYHPSPNRGNFLFLYKLK
ncbi:GPI mannosyltransferase 3 [Microplitis demolitor]|uniref:GPI mannosyltransferase 3 n=1 Tax=Microplitis demolitor TaxID=69319 RepID=UPI0004CCDB28|nr:GPI mannosyltransferase 3 [Microplitis demolitor]